MNEVLVNSSSKTMIFVSHRLSTVAMTDRILVFEKGELVENGNHETLIKTDGVYAKLFHQQTRQILGKRITE